MDNLDAENVAALAAALSVHDEAAKEHMKAASKHLRKSHQLARDLERLRGERPQPLVA